MIQEASLPGLIKVILWLLVISAIVRFFIRLTAQYAVHKVNDEVNRNRRREGDVTVQGDTKKSAKEADGDYVDFIEIKD
jgi:hypothetical protein